MALMLVPDPIAAIDGMSYYCKHLGIVLINLFRVFPYVQTRRYIFNLNMVL